jgi:hypothetical protein
VAGLSLSFHRERKRIGKRKHSSMNPFAKAKGSAFDIFGRIEWPSEQWQARMARAVNWPVNILGGAIAK